MNKYVLTSLAVVVGATSLQAQLQTDGRAGVGRETSAQLDADTLNTSNGNLGVAMSARGGADRIYVTHRGNMGGTAAPHSIGVWDYDFNTGAATFVSEIQQDPFTSASGWGYRDGARDDVSGLMFFGVEGGIQCIDENGVAQTTFNGQTIPNPIVESSGALGTHRGVAYDPLGNGGAGSLFSGNFGSDIFEFALDGTLLHQYPQPAAGTQWSTYGLAVSTDASGNRTLWINSAPNAGETREYAVTRGPGGPGSMGMMVETGRVMANTVAGGIQGGLDRATQPMDGRGFGSDLIEVKQGTPDTVVGRRENLFDVNSAADGVLTATVGAGLPAAGTQRYLANAASGDWAATVTPGTGTAPQGVWLLGFGNAANPVPFVDAGFTLDNGQLDLSLIEVALAWITNPGQVLQVPFAPTSPSDSTLTIPQASLDAAGSIDFALQGVYLDPANTGPFGQLNGPGAILQPNGPGFPIATSNVIGLEVRPAPRFSFSAAGANSFNGDTTSGFFQVTNNDPAEIITQVTISSANVTTGNATLVFDSDQGGMADRFDGNLTSAVALCLGTYRNGSEVASGLVFAGTNASLCDPTLTTGWTGSNTTAVAPNFQTLQFDFDGASFTQGVTFEWDTDTDGGAGITGAAMADLEVSITTNVATYSGVLTASGADSSVFEVF